MVEYHCPESSQFPTANLTSKELMEILMAEEDAEVIYKMPTFILLALLMIVGLPGNLLVLLVYGFRFPASTTKTFIMAMAAFDLLNCVMGMPFEMVDLGDDVKLDIPVVCKIMRFLVTLNACGSVTVLVVVSVDRFRRICRPFQKQMSVSLSRGVVGAMLIVSLVFAFPALALYGRQTSQRYGVKMYECTIDDKYKNSSVAAGYQFVLVGMWVICIGILIVMYGFIIYKIQKQKKRREKLSSQGGSAVLTRLQPPVIEINLDQGRKAQQSNALTSSDTIIGDGDTTNNGGCSQAGDRPSKFNKMNGDNSTKQPSVRSVRRLFSRDVNPIFEESEHNDEIDDVNFSEDDIISLSERFKKSKSADMTKSSLNNYLAASQDTELARRSVSMGRTSFSEPPKPELSSSVTPTRSRKLGLSMGRYRPWESEEIMRTLSVVSSAADREWVSHSCAALDSNVTTVQMATFSMRRASSLPCLQPSGNVRIAKTLKSGKYVVNENQSNGGITDSGDESRASMESFGEGDNVKDEKSFTSQSDNLSFCLRLQSGKSSVQANNVTWDSLEVCHSPRPSSDNSHSGLSQGGKSRSASVATTLTQNYKRKASVREIKTSKVSFMMLLVTLGFVLSYLPHLGIQLFKAVSPMYMAHLLCTSHSYFVIHHLCMRSFFFNNAINPIIYSFYNKTFRQRCIRLLKAPRYLFVSSEQQPLSVSQDNDTA